MSAKKQKTLFSFFTKKNTPAKDGDTPSKQKDVLGNRQQSVSPKNDQDLASLWKPGDLAWSKLEGYPWWPSLVCNHPTQNTHIWKGKRAAVHVQFFDDPTSRSWIKARFIKPYTGSQSPEFQVRGGQFYTSDPECLKWAVEADDTRSMSREERLKLVTHLLPSDEESADEEPMEVEPLNLDSDIFDPEIGSDDEQNNSKENHCEEEEKKKSQSPKKGRKCSSRPQAKRRKVLADADSGLEDSEDEFKPNEDEGSSDDESSSGEDEADISDIEIASEDASPVKLSHKRKKSSSKKPMKSPEGVIRQRSKGSSRPGSQAKQSLHKFSKVESTDDEDGQDRKEKKESGTVTASTRTPVSDRTMSKLSMFKSDATPEKTVENLEGRGFVYLKYQWLKDENLRDIKKNPKWIQDKCQSKEDGKPVYVLNEEYDPKTLYIPEQALKEMTPGGRQWWEIKQQHFDTVLFFKMGKFYELFHMDAAIGVKELGLLYMKGDNAHAGFPEIAFGRYSETLIQKGYKIARIEQTETPEMMNDRVKKIHRPTKFDKVVRREVCRITTKGTQVYSFIDGNATSVQSAYLMAICEREESDSKGSSYGVCFVDSSIGKFYIGQFEDDRHCSRFRTLVSHYQPAQVLYEKGKITERTQSVLKNNLPSALKDALRPEEFWGAKKTLEILMSGGYFEDEKSERKLPDIFKKLTIDSDTLAQTPADGYELAIRCLGAVTWYLKDCLIDQELLSMKNFQEYVPFDTALSSTREAKSVTAFPTGTQHMVLDGVTLTNLDILENAETGSLEGTLLDRLDMCSTPFGKRLFKQWLCAPLCHPDPINDRLDAMDDLISCQDVVAEVTEMLKKMPDLQRLLSRVHALGAASRKKHPDSRAIMYEELTYGKKKIEDFLSSLEGFQTAVTIMEKFATIAEKFKSKVLRQSVTPKQDGGHFPDFRTELTYFQKAFDHKKARKEGTIKPCKGVDPEYDTALDDIQSTKKELDDYLMEQRKRCSCQAIVYWGTGKSRYQLEMPESAAKKVPDSYELTSSKKGYKRFWSAKIKSLLEDLTDAEDRQDLALRDCMRRIFHTFDESYQKWDAAVQCLSVLDVLLSLAEFSRCGDGTMTRPELVMPGPGQQAFLELREARHPCIGRTFSHGDYIPNDTVIGIRDENDMDDDAGVNASSQVVLVTGPNMGGKSTLMRQVGVLVILAQLGCYVPAEACRLTPTDRVFTRLGASDRIMAGESTFMVELSETSSILQHATCHSLVLLDELGRGTATYDGTAIACAVVHELSQNIRCRTLFSTHYHSLVEQFSHDPNVRLGHMACMVENENEAGQETITFLYKFVKGSCPKSYGFNAARLADLPEEIIQVALKKAKQFENAVDSVHWFRDLYLSEDDSRIKELHSVINVM